MTYKSFIVTSENIINKVTVENSINTDKTILVWMSVEVTWYMANTPYGKVESSNPGNGTF